MKRFQKLSQEVIDAKRELDRLYAIRNQTVEEAQSYGAADQRWHDALTKLREASVSYARLKHVEL